MTANKILFPGNFKKLLYSPKVPYFSCKNIQEIKDFKVTQKYMAESGMEFISPTLGQID